MEKSLRAFEGEVRRFGEISAETARRVESSAVEMTIDSNVIIDYLQGKPEVRQRFLGWKQENRVLIIPTIVSVEVLASSKLTSEEIQLTQEFLNQFFSVPLDDHLASEAARLRRETGLHTPDSIVAATALHTGTPLVTRDRHFRKVKDLVLVDI